MSSPHRRSSIISGTQWIDAFPGRLGPHIGRLAKLLGEDEAATEPAVAAELIAIGGGWALWPKPQPERSDTPIDPAILTRPVWPKDPQIEARVQQQMAAIPGDVTMVGGKTAEAGGASGTAGSPSDASSTDPDFRAYEKLAGKDGIEACNRAIASGWELSYIYSDRGYLLMQKGTLPALADLKRRQSSIPPISMRIGIGARFAWPRAISPAPKAISPRLFR